MPKTPYMNLRLSAELIVSMMKFHKVLYPEVQKLVLTMPKLPNPKYNGLRHFNKTRMASIKYYNPEIEVRPVFERAGTDCKIDITFKDGTTTSMDASGKDSPDIWDELLTVARGQDLVPKMVMHDTPDREAAKSISEGSSEAAAAAASEPAAAAAAEQNQAAAQ